jgi:hypothetical protein
MLPFSGERRRRNRIANQKFRGVKMAVDWEAYAKGVEAQIARIKKDLAPLEAGELKLGERQPGSPWRDVTQESIDRNKQALETNETILKDVRENRIERDL